MRKTWRIAAHEIVTPQGKLTLGVVELENGVVKGWRSLDGEEPSTEWLGGTIRLAADCEGHLRAYNSEGEAIRKT